MASSTLLYIAWPLTLGLSFIAGSIDLSDESTTEQSKVLHRYSSKNRSANKNSAATNRRTSAPRGRVVQDGYAESYDFKDIANISDPQKRLIKLLSMIDQLGPGDFEQVLADFNDFDDQLIEVYYLEYRTLLKAWTKINPEGALAYAKENTTRMQWPTSPGQIILTTWAGYAPDAAIQWVKLNYEGDKASPYLVDIIDSISITNPERATEILQELPSGGDRNKAIDIIAWDIGKLGIEKAIAWFATIKDKKLQARATRTLARSLAKKDPQATINWLKTLSVKALNDNIPNIASSWPKQDIDKAVEWANSLEGKNRVSAARNMIGKFAYSDPLKAATWMKTMSDEPNYNKLVGMFMSYAHIHPEIVLMNLDQIDNLSDRNSRREMSLINWATKDKNAATQWMQSNNIDAAAQEKILSDAANNYPWRRW